MSETTRSVSGISDKEIGAFNISEAKEMAVHMRQEINERANNHQDVSDLNRILRDVETSLAINLSSLSDEQKLEALQKMVATFKEVEQRFTLEGTPHENVMNKMLKALTAARDLMKECCVIPKEQETIKEKIGNLFKGVPWLNISTRRLDLERHSWSASMTGASATEMATLGTIGERSAENLLGDENYSLRENTADLRKRKFFGEKLGRKMFREQIHSLQMTWQAMQEEIRTYKMYPAILNKSDSIARQIEELTKQAENIKSQIEANKAEMAKLPEEEKIKEAINLLKKAEAYARSGDIDTTFEASVKENGLIKFDESKSKLEIPDYDEQLKTFNHQLVSRNDLQLEISRDETKEKSINAQIPILNKNVEEIESAQRNIEGKFNDNGSFVRHVEQPVPSRMLYTTSNPEERRNIIQQGIQALENHAESILRQQKQKIREYQGESSLIYKARNIIGDTSRSVFKVLGKDVAPFVFKEAIPGIWNFAKNDLLKPLGGGIKYFFGTERQQKKLDKTEIKDKIKDYGIVRKTGRGIKSLWGGVTSMLGKAGTAVGNFGIGVANLPAMALEGAGHVVDATTGILGAKPALGNALRGLRFPFMRRKKEGEPNPEESK